MGIKIDCAANRKPATFSTFTPVAQFGLLSAMVMKRPHVVNADYFG